MSGRDTATGGNQPSESEILGKLHRTLTETTGPFTEKVEALLAVGQSHLAMDAGVVAAVDGDRYEIELLSGDDELLADVSEGTELPLSETVCERTLEDGDTYAVDDIPTEAPELADRAAVIEFDGRRYIGTPLLVDDEPYGTLCFYGTERAPDDLDDRDRTLVEFMSQLVSYELEHELDQQRLKATKSELESVFERVDDAVFAVDTDWNVTYVNDRAERVLGIEATQLVGEQLFEQFPDIEGSIFHDQFARAIETQSTVTFEALYEPLDACFEVTAYPTETGLSVYVTDITNRKQRRTELERYEQILDTVSDGVYALDENERFTYANEGLAELTGYSRQQLIGSHIGLFKSDETVEAARTAVTEEIHRVLDGKGTGEIEIDLTVERADGQQVDCQDHIALLPFDERFRGSVGTIRDISAQLERERTLNGLLESTRALMVAETPTAVADEIVDTVAEVLGFERTLVRWYDEEADQLVPMSVSPTLRAELDTVEPIQRGDGLVGSTFEAGKTAICEPVDSEHSDAGAASSLAVVPLGSHGTLTIGIDDPSGCNNSDRQLIELLAANAEAAFERTDRQQELRRYETLVETAQEMLCVLDSNGRFQLITEPLAEFVGHPREALVETPARTLFDAESAETVESVFESLKRDADRTTVSVDVTIETVDRGTVPIRIEASKLPQAANQEFIVSVHDRSELVSAKQAAAAERDRFSYLFENLTDPINEIEHVDDQSHVRGYNRAFQQLFGEPAVDDRRELRTNGDSDPLAVEDDRIIDTAAPEPAAETDRELKLQTAEGIRHFLYQQVPYELDGSRRRFEIYTDVTALKQREIQLQVLHRLLRHNLRNDLNVVAGFADLLVEELDTDRHVGFAERIAANVTDLIELSDTAKTIESVAGRQSLDRDPLDVDSVLASLVETVRTEYPEATVSLDASESTVVAAGPHLRTALEELVENAVEHNTTAEPAVSISVQQADELVSITVADNGPGVPDAEWAVVTGDSEISQLEHGSGLGLWLVRWVAEAYGGTLERDATVDGGAVSIRLPAVDGD